MEYDFREFINSLAGRSYFETLKLANEEAYRAEVKIRGRTVSREKKELDRKRLEYRRKLGAVCFFLQQWIQPGDLEKHEFQMLRPLCEHWVETGQVLPWVLNSFGKQKSSPLEQH